MNEPRSLPVETRVPFPYNPSVIFSARTLRHVAMTLTAVGFVGALAGCEPSSRVRLDQPHLEGWQREMNLRSDAVTWAAGGDMERVLAEFPLPGAATGKPMYLLYLRLPAGVEELDVTPGQAAAARGFFIQMRGQLAGLAMLTNGHVEVTGESQSRDAIRKLTLDLTCEDGSRLTGELRARRDDWHVQQFETRRRPADVHTLEHGAVPADAAAHKQTP